MANQTRAKIKDCIAVGINTTEAIAEHLDLEYYYTLTVLRAMRKDQELTRHREGKSNVYSFTPPRHLHDPFGLCRKPLQDEKATKGSLQSNAKRGYGERLIHFLEAPNRGEYIGAGNGTVEATD